MSQIADRAMNAPADAFKSAVRTTGGIAAGGVGIGAAMALNRRFRYIMQAVLHFPMAFFVAFFLIAPRMAMNIDSTMGPEAEQAAMLQAIGQGALIGLIVAVVWTAAYIILRTRPKLRRLNQS